MRNYRKRWQSTPATTAGAPIAHLLIAPLLIAPLLIGCAFLCLYAGLALIRFHRFALNSWDNAIFEQAIKAYAHLGAPMVPIKGPDFNLLGDHFSPIIALVAPFYRLAPSAQTVLLAQVVLVAISVVTITGLAMRRVGRLSGMAIGVAYGLSFGIQAAVQAEFHEVAFAVPLLALAGAAYVDRRWKHVVLWSLPLLLVKEDLGLTVALIGFVLFLAGQRVRGAGLAAAGVVGALLVLLVIVPHFNPSGGYDYAAKVGGGGGVFSTLLTGLGQKVLTVVLTLGITGFLALRSPWVLLVVPTFAWRFAGENSYYWGTSWHYSLTLMPIVFVAMIDGVVRIRKSGPRWSRAYAGRSAAICLAVALTMQLHSPLAGLLRTTTSPERLEAAHDALAVIPPDSSVETDIGLIGHLVTDHEVYWTGTVGDTVTDYVLVDERAWGTAPDVVAAAQARTGASYELVFARDGFAVAKLSRQSTAPSS